MNQIRHRRDTRGVKVGHLTIGGSDLVTVQSMTTTKTKDVEATVAQINALAKAQCDIVRVACVDEEDARAVKEIKKQTTIPIVADIHFNYELALISIENGIDAVRLNPGNIGSDDKVRAVVKAAKEKGIPIRIGVNAGSLEKHIIEKHGYPTAAGMVESALYHIKILEDLEFYDIVVSLKATEIELAVAAYEMAAKKIPYPLHLGITESGTLFSGTIKSSIGLGILLKQGIGSTIRVSLSDDPVEEVKVGREILKNFHLVHNMATLVSCPTCGRIEIDLIPLAKRVEAYLENIPYNIKVAVMGCPVNGPGEAKDADIGLAGGKKQGILFRKGEIVRKVPEAEMFEALVEEIQKIVVERNSVENYKGNSCNE